MESAYRTIAQVCARAKVPRATFYEHLRKNICGIANKSVRMETGVGVMFKEGANLQDYYALMENRPRAGKGPKKKP